MKTAFLCGSLEPSRDGVGDYTRRLAGELIRQGHPSVIVGLNDPHVSEAVFDVQKIEGASISVLRLPVTMPWNERATAARKWLDDFNLDWVSLQFVPFGFHPKGLVFELPGQLKNIIGTRPLHWMFHELWVLWNFPLSLRKRLLGQCQKISVWSGLRNLKPQVITTQLVIHQMELNKLGLEVDVVPLHGNIPVYPKAGADEWLARRCTSLTGTKWVKVGFFGNILPTLNSALFRKRIAELNIPPNELLVLSAGKISGETASLWNSLKEEFKSLATFLEVGHLNEHEASHYFAALDYGLTSYPPELMGKSGSVAAMREHGLRVISCGTLGKKTSGGNKTDNQKVDPDGSWSVNRSALAFLQQIQKAGL